MTLDDFKAKYPDLYKTIFEEGEKAGHAKGLTEGETTGLEKGKAEVQADAKAEGAKTEMERIQAVEAQSIPGHEKLIQELKFDGKTTGDQAAVQILQAEKALRLNMNKQLDDDAVPPVGTALNQGIDDTTASTPDGPDKWKAEYEKSAELQKEFKACETYVAFKQGVADGNVKILGKEAK